MGREALPGWFDYSDVYDEAVRLAPNFATCIEVGVGFGLSLSYLAQEAMRVTKKLHVVGVDPFYDDWDTDHPTWGANHAEMARKLGGPFNAVTALMHEHAPRELEYVHLMRCRSVQAARMFDDASVHFVFIDGSHHYEDVKADLAAWEPKIAKGGIIAGHDYHAGFPGVKRAVDERWPDMNPYGEKQVCFWRRL